MRAWHSAQRGNQLSRPVKAKSKSLATVVTEDMLKPTRRIGADSIVMQSTFADDRKMQDQGFKGIINYIDYATRRSFPFAIRKVGDAALAGRKFDEMCEEIREEYYGSPDVEDWPVQEVTVIHDAGPEFGQAWKDAVEETLGDGAAARHPTDHPEARFRAPAYLLDRPERLAPCRGPAADVTLRRS